MPGYIYLIMMADGVYKVGRTHQDYGPHLKRLKAYPGDSIIVTVQKVLDGGVVEKEVLRRCRDAFGDHPRGHEYFNGTEREFIKIIYECIDFVPPPPPPPPVRDPQSVPCNEVAMVNCPKCHRTFTHAKYLSKANEHLQRHLNRANPCDDSTGSFKFERKKTRDTVPSIDTLDLTGLVESLDNELQFHQVTGHIFKVLNDRNCFAVWPNTKMYEIYFMDGDVLRYVTPTVFIFEFCNRVMIDQVKPLLADRWYRYNDYTEWIVGKSYHGMKKYDSTEVSYINSLMRTEVYTDMKNAILNHLKTVPRGERFQTRVNMSAEVPESS